MDNSRREFWLQTAAALAGGGAVAGGIAGASIATAAAPSGPVRDHVALIDMTTGQRVQWHEQKRNQVYLFIGFDSNTSPWEVSLWQLVDEENIFEPTTPAGFVPVRLRQHITLFARDQEFREGSGITPAVFMNIVRMCKSFTGTKYANEVLLTEPQYGVPVVSCKYLDNRTPRPDQA